MCVMSVETWIQVKRKETISARKRYYLELIIGYAVPFVLVLLTGIVEALAPRCSQWKPQHLEGSCFFAGMYLIIVTTVLQSTNSHMLAALISFIRHRVSHSVTSKSKWL